jgi:minor extracellular serine protease Vpr
MATDGTANQPTIPAYGVSLVDGQALRAVGGTTTTIAAVQQYFSTPNSDIMASFSSQGPSDVDFRVKPDVVAPGVNVLSSIPHAFCAAPPCFAFFQGTSMATPHLAGTAAFLRGLHADWSAADIRSAIVNTAVRGVLRRTSNPAQVEANVNIAGAGREDVVNAMNAAVALAPVSVSYGAVPSGSGDTRSVDVTLHNLGSGTATFDLSATGGDASVAFTVATSSVTLAGGASATVTVNMVPARGAATGGHQGILEVKSGGTSVAHAALYTLIK